MNIEQLKEQIPDETSCRMFFEKIIWSKDRFCPHDCVHCKRQFAVASQTPMHSTKLPPWKSLLAFYFMINPIKGISSVFFLGPTYRSQTKHRL
jgi:hypothetical protein